MAGYSKRSLVDKLGIKPGHKVAILNPPAGYDAVLGPLPDDVALAQGLRGTLDLIHLFTHERAVLERRFPEMKAHLAQTGCVWISWPKKVSKVPTDITEDVVRDIGLRAGLVDVKVAAVDEVWSGLKFMIRLKDRK